jgi:hypothetical protein
MAARTGSLVGLMLASGTQVQVYRRVMSTEALEPQTVWAPAACTLPTADRPLREAEFDELFAQSLRGIERPGRTTVRMALDPTPEVAARAANLVVRETGCCSFFTFTLVASDGALRLDITVPPTQSEVLEALAARAAAGLPS